MRKLSRQGLAAAAASVLLVGGAGAYAAHDANTIHGCHDATSGSLRVASICRANEKVLEWNKQGPEGPPGPPGPRAEQLRIVDAEGTTVGPLVALRDSMQGAGPQTLHNDLTLVDGLIWGLESDTGRFRGAYLEVGNVVFTTPDCAGQPYLWQHGQMTAFFSPSPQATFELLFEGHPRHFIVDGPKLGADATFSWLVANDGTRSCVGSGSDLVLLVPVQPVSPPASVPAPTTIAS